MGRDTKDGTRVVEYVRNAAIKAWKITTDDYKRAFDLPDEPQNTQSEGKENAPNGNIPNPKLEKALDFAIRTREFEIGLFWKRSNMFMLLTGAAFVGLYTVTNASGICNLLLTRLSKKGSSLDDAITNLIQGSYFYALIIAFAGLVFAIAWHLICRGSLFWPKNWEAHIAALQRPLMGPIYDYVHYDDAHNKPCNPLKAYPFSVSKIMNVTTFAVILFWLIVLIKIIMDIIGFNPIAFCFEQFQNHKGCCLVIGGIIMLIFIGGVFPLFRYLCKSSFIDYIDKNEADTQQEPDISCPFIELSTWGSRLARSKKTGFGV